nr:MAG TPA: hypothetical protein [Caudoviricetes sp.]
MPSVPHPLPEHTGKVQGIGLGIPRADVFFPSLKAADHRLRTPQKTHTRDTSEA